jgi:hypothetical protein
VPVARSKAARSALTKARPSGYLFSGALARALTSTFELEALARGQLQVGLVNEAVRSEGVAGGPAAQAPQLVVDEGDNLVQGVADPRPRGPGEAR